MRELIRRERQVELCFENLRYFDIADLDDGRDGQQHADVYGMNIVGQRPQGERRILAARHLQIRRRPRRQPRIFAKRCYLFPISQEELDRVKCTQNYGW